MKILKSITATVSTMALSSMLVTAQDSDPIVSGYLIKANSTYERVLVMGSNNAGNIFYKDNPKSVKTVKAPISSFSGIWLFEPQDFTDAKNLFEARKYQEAKDAFIALQKRYTNYKYLDNSYYELSQYFEMECYRKLKDYETLSKKLGQYQPKKLTRASQVLQTKLYKLYEAVNKKDWKGLSSMSKELAGESKLTLSQRAQLAFCEGLAYEGLKKNDDALNSYAIAMTTDFTRSETVVRESALNSLRILEADEKVQAAIKSWGSPGGNKGAGYAKLLEANALARLYDKAGFGGGVELPANLKKLQEFTSPEMEERLKAKK